MTGLRLMLAGLVAFAACNAPAVETAAAPPAPDTAAVRTEIQALLDRTEASYLAGDAAAVAATYADSAIAEFQGFPTAIGRPAIESSYAQYFAANRLKVAEMTIGSVSPTSPATATTLGAYHSFGESAGKPVHQWWRYLAAYEKGADGQWKISYIMAFVDSSRTE